MSRARRTSGKPALELLEEAAAALRGCAPLTLMCYYAGTVPFILAFLYFWADMSAGAYAEWHRSGAALGMGCAFVWMKCWQAVFAERLLVDSGAEEPRSWSVGRVWRMTVQQTAVQATGFFVLPVAMVLTLPAAWTYAFYQNFLLDGRGDKEPLRELIGRSIRQSTLWSKQNHLAIAYLSAFGLVVFVNFLTLVMVMPNLLKTLLGVETVFSRSGFHLFNTTVMMIAASLTHLTIDPVVKAFYVLRCFHGRSVQSGDDLKVNLRRLRRGASTVGVVFLTLLLLGVGRAEAASSSGRISSPLTDSAPSANLDRAIQQVLTRPEFAWRSPRVPEPFKPDANPGVFERFVKAVGDFVKACWKPIRRWIRSFFDWIEELIPRSRSNYDPSTATSWKGTLEIILYSLCALIASAAAIIAWRAWRERRSVPVVTAQAVSVTPDLRSEEVTADQLPEDRWLQLSEEMAAKGDFRLALRALYLAGLAHLGLRELITLTRSRSNKEFRVELARRARARTDLLSAFGEAVHAFERAWYGSDEVTRDIVARYALTVDQIRKC